MKNNYTIPYYSIHNEKEIKGFFGEKYRFLSNFYSCNIKFNGLIYTSSECAYQAQKVKEMDRFYFQHCTASESKSLWKRYGSIYNKQEWDAKKLDLMKIIVFIKFYKNLDLRKELLNTGDRYLEELNHWRDSFWGVNCKTGIGQNQLGKILMKIRDYWR